MRFFGVVLLICGVASLGWGQEKTAAQAERKAVPVVRPFVTDPGQLERIRRLEEAMQRVIEVRARKGLGRKAAVPAKRLTTEEEKESITSRVGRLILGTRRPT